jgi:acyl carrier protein
MLSAREVGAVVNDILCGEFGVDPDAIGPDARLETLGIDSLCLVEVLRQAEARFGRRVPDWALWGAQTLQQAVDGIHRALSTSPPPR